jgi:lysozyme
MNEDLKLTPEGIKLIQHFEGCLQPHQGKYKAYKCPAGVTTIGWGTTNEGKNKFDMSTHWTKEQCDKAFVDDMEAFEKDVRRLVTVDLSTHPHRFSALVSFCYNCGAGNLQKSTLLKYVNQQKWDAAAAEFPKWNKANGKVMAGLTRRRASERVMFEGGQDQNFDGKADHPMPQAVDEPTD